MAFIVEQTNIKKIPEKFVKKYRKKSRNIEFLLKI